MLDVTLQSGENFIYLFIRFFFNYFDEQKRREKNKNKIKAAYKSNVR